MAKKLSLLFWLAYFSLCCFHESRYLVRIRGRSECSDNRILSNTTGKFELELNKAETKADVELTVNDGVRITQAHLHCAPVGVNGPVVVFLSGLNAAGYNVDGEWISNATLTDTSISNPACGATISALAASMRVGEVYVNVHSVANPGGVVRGQVEPTVIAVGILGIMQR